jgi:hypothetical protein
MLWAGTDARVYSLIMLLGLAALYFALEGRWLGLAAVAGLTAYAHRVAPAVAVAAFVVALTVHRSEWKRIGLAGLAAGVAWMPVMVTLLMAAKYDFWAPPLTPGYAWMAFTDSVFTWTWSGFAVLAPMVLLALTLTLTLRRDTTYTPLLAWTVPLALLVGVSLAWKSVVTYRTLQSFLPAFGLWLGWSLGRSPRRVWQMILLAGWALVAIFTRYNPAMRGGHIDEAAAMIRSNWQPGDVIYYTTFTAQCPFDHYLGDLPSAMWTGVVNPFLTTPGVQAEQEFDIDAVSGRVWVITPLDPLLTPADWDYIHALTAGGELLYSTDAPQFAPIEIWLLGE